jgi:hypothetical protein
MKCYTRASIFPAALLSLAASAMAADAPANAAQPTLIDNLDVGLSVGTMGPGGQVSWLLVPGKLSVRVAANAYNYNHDTNSGNVDYAGKLKLKSELLLLDWHPFEGRFRLTGGVVANGNKFDLLAKPNGGTYDINGNTYTAAQVGTLSAKVDFPSSAPYLGIGWGDSTQSAGLHFIGDIGVIAQGSPKAKLTASGGTLSNDPNVQADLKKAETDLQTKLNDFKVYPLVQLGIAYRF